MPIPAQAQMRFQLIQFKQIGKILWEKYQQHKRNIEGFQLIQFKQIGKIPERIAKQTRFGKVSN